MRAPVACILLFAAGCSKHAPKTYQVEIRGMQFVPASLTVDVGDTVVWTNKDIFPHTVTSGIPAPMAFDSKEVAPKAQWSLTVGAAGEYSYGCTYHPTMKATLTAR